mgnify:CR=1 FL=1
MPEFLKKASCRGRRPLHLVPRRQIPRPNLIAKLLRERHVARFIVAPDGFGKTGLAMEYMWSGSTAAARASCAISIAAS